jgi:hypothetical protein
MIADKYSWRSGLCEKKFNIESILFSSLISTDKGPTSSGQKPPTLENGNSMTKNYS